MKKTLLLVALILASVPALARDNNTLGGKAVSNQHTYTVFWKQPNFIPQDVHDDGKFTFIEFGKNTPPELPVFFELSEDGSKVLRNFVYEPELNRIRISGLFRKGELRLGNESVRINRNPE